MLRVLRNLPARPLTFLCAKEHSSSVITLEDIFTKMSESKVFRKARYDGRSKKRQWEERRTDKGEGLDPTLPKKPRAELAESTTTEKVKRKKIVLLMGYSGANFFGMQRNPNTATIEEELFKALKNTGMINEECYNQVQNMQFQRAARTDKGVSAARQIVSLKLGENIDLSKINAELPETIKVFAYKRVTKGFNSKSQCDSRTYIYILPTVSFANQNQEVSQKDFRLSNELHKKVNEALSCYVGTKNFHNFTSKKKPNDPSAKRFIKSFVCEKPFVKEGVEFAILKVHGQSFMLHQIRKMVGLALAIVRGLATIDIMDTAFNMEKLSIPRAPGLGLVLDYVHYDRYNERYGDDGMHEKLTWEHVENEVNEFRDKYIFPNIIHEEIQNEPMVYWLRNKLSRHSYTDKDENESDEENEQNEDEVELSNIEQISSSKLLSV